MSLSSTTCQAPEPPTRRIWLVSYCHHRSRAWTTRCLSTVALRRTATSECSAALSADVRNGHSANGILTPLRQAPLWPSLSTAAHLPKLAVASANFGRFTTELVVHRFSGFCNSRGNEWSLAWTTTVSSRNSEVARRMCFVGASLAPSCVQRLPRLRDIVRWSAIPLTFEGDTVYLTPSLVVRPETFTGLGPLLPL